MFLLAHSCTCFSGVPVLHDDADAWSACPYVPANQPRPPCHLPAEVIKNKGLEKITVEQLVDEITPHGRATVPEETKAELLNRIRTFLQTN